MSPPITRPFPCFIADSPQEGRPYGQWAKRLEEEFAKACGPHADEAGAPLDPETIRWFPERGWGGRVYVPGTGRATEPTGGGEPKEGEQAADPVLVEYFGHVSFVRPEDGEPGDCRANADFTDVTAEDNPELEDRPLGRRDRHLAGGGRSGRRDHPGVGPAAGAGRGRRHRGARRTRSSTRRLSRTAGSRWSPSTRMRGFGDELYLEIRLWDRTLREIATESLYAYEGRLMAMANGS